MDSPDARSPPPPKSAPDQPAPRQISPPMAQAVAWSPALSQPPAQSIRKAAAAETPPAPPAPPAPHPPKSTASTQSPAASDSRQCSSSSPAETIPETPAG